MSDKYPDLSSRQVYAYKEVQRIEMAWFILYCMMGIVAALTAAVIWFIYLERHWAATTATGLLDGIFGTCLVKIISFHWPSKQNEAPELGAASS